MTDSAAMTETGMMTESETAVQSHSVEAFAIDNAEYYAAEFDKIQGQTGFAWSWNMMAAVFGPLWGAARGVWGFFWIFLVLELFALVQLGRGLWGQLGADQLVRYDRLIANIAKREAQAAELTAAGDVAGADAKLKIANNLKGAADKALEAANAASSEATGILITGVILVVLIKLAEGYYANYAYESQYLRWRASSNEQAGIKRSSILFGLLGLLAIWPLTLIRFTVADPNAFVAKLTGGLLGDRISITEFPVGREYFAYLSKKGDAGFDWLANNFGDVFDGVTAGIRWVLDGLEILLIQTPWPVVMFVTVVLALRACRAQSGDLYSRVAGLSRLHGPVGDVDDHSGADRRRGVPVRGDRHSAGQSGLACPNAPILLPNRFWTSCRPCLPLCI